MKKYDYLVKINTLMTKGCVPPKYFDIETSLEELEFNYKLMQFRRIKEIYFELDDKKDLFNEIAFDDIGDNYICYAEWGEYGHLIKICDKSGEEIYDLFLSKDMMDENGEKYITSFWNHKIKKGLNEKIYSNRTEHYVDGKYHSMNFNDEIMEIIKSHTKLIEKYPSLYNFVMKIKNNEDDITLIPIREMIVINQILNVIIGIIFNKMG